MVNDSLFDFVSSETKIDTFIFIERREISDSDMPTWKPWRQVGDDEIVTNRNICVLLGKIASMLDEDKRNGVESQYRIVKKVFTTELLYSDKIKE
jgi:hypothetical protein